MVSQTEGYLAVIRGDESVAKKKTVRHKKKKVTKTSTDSFLEIDEDNLDREWLGQSALYCKYAQRAARERFKVDEAKARLDVVRAKLDKAIRSDPGEFDLEKVTESQVSNTILLQPDYEDALKAVHEAQYDVRMVEAAVGALDQRRKALENLVYLHGQQYWSTPRANDETSAEAIEDITRKGTRRPVRKKSN